MWRHSYPNTNVRLVCGLPKAREWRTDDGGAVTKLSVVKYQELKALIKQKCNISQFILDNLVSEEDGTKKVRIGVADENEGSILFRNLDGYSMNGYRLRVQPVGKTPLLTNFQTVHMASKRKSLCIDEKVLLIRAIEMGEKISDVGKRFGFSRSTVSTIWKNKEKILQAESEGKSCKKLKKPKYEDLDQAILSWFHQQRQNNMPISGPLVKAKAENFAEELGLAAFKASEGWLGKFKQRHHINYGKISGEARSVDTNMTHDWINKVWSKFKEKYAPSDIFNADEAGIFYKLTPDKTLKFKGEKCVGGKLSKERITVLVAANMDGTEKRKLMVIGKSKNPRCFKNITKLPVTYKANKSAWMTSQLFEEEVRNTLCNSTSDVVETEPEFDSDDDLPLTEWIQQFNTAGNTVHLQTYIEVDDSPLTTASLTDQEILDSVRNTEDQEQGDEEDETDEPEPPSIKEALKQQNYWKIISFITKIPQYCKI
ncbi:Tigger transposable element-derived protein 4 [Eumeta japonica]|uniref:Tigger transposable element-derived protein 4 n=1 Tax=Eumeta variegata TaxID=151549 RepID=A0A4C2ABT3_EUMVA|nr:Tigger transposable element-derived protein 4 [Eumeta japonica]